MYSLANDPVYLDSNNSDAKRKAAENRAIVRAFFSVMNLSNLYCYAPNMSEDWTLRAACRAGCRQRGRNAGAGRAGLLQSVERLLYAAGNRLPGRVLRPARGRLSCSTTRTCSDYARKAAKASLDADIKYNRMRQGKASVAEWEKAQAIFDNLSKSANFAACKRKPGDMAGLGS